MKKITLLLLISTLSFSAFANNPTYLMNVEYKLGYDKSFPVAFFESLDITTYSAIIEVNGSLVECTSSREVVYTYKRKNSYVFGVEFSSDGPCEDSYKDRYELIKVLSEELKSFPVIIF